MKNHQAINSNTVRVVFDALQHKIEQADPSEDSLLTGRLGLSLYYFTLYEVFGEEQFADRCITLLDEVMNREEYEKGGLSGPGFANGTSGLGFILSLYNENNVVETDIAGDFAIMDQQIYTTALSKIRQEGSLDYLHGAMGALHYFSQRSNEPVIRDYLDVLIDSVCQQAVLNSYGSWFPSFITDKNERNFINTSLSHGNTGFLLILLQLMEKGICSDKIKEAVRNGIRLLLHLRMKPDPANSQYSFFPFTVNRSNSDDRHVNNRLAWCYGDIGIIFLLYKAAALCDEPAWKNEADDIASFILARTTESSTLVTDSHFCHGAAGLAHIYQKLFILTGQLRFKEGADHWMNMTFEYLDTEMKNDHYKGREGDLLNGLAGIGMVLLSRLSQKELAWDRLLLL